MDAKDCSRTLLRYCTGRCRQFSFRASSGNGVAVQGYWSQRDRACIIPTGTLPLGGVSGVPTLIQSRFGDKGHFELVTPMASGGLAHYWRNNDDPAIPWHGPTIFGQELGTVGSISLIERKFGNPGNLELVAGVGTNIDFLWRDSGPESARNGPTPIAAKGISPVLIQSRFGAMGKFEILAIEPSFTPDGGIVHYWRNDDDSSLPWSEPTVFGRDPARQTPIESLTFIQSNFANPGNLEVIVRSGDQFMFFWRDSGPAFNWNGPFAVTAGS